MTAKDHTVKGSVWVPASIYEPRDTQWLWWPRIPFGHLTILAGRGGSGKGLFATDLVSRLTTYDFLPTSDERAAPGNCIWVETEDDINETMIPRLIASGADLSKVMILTPQEFFALESGFAAANNVRLIVLSPLVSCLEGIKKTNDEMEVRNQLETLCSGIKGTLISIFGLMHLNKKTDLATVERILGSGAFANYSRSVLFTCSEEDSDKKRLVHEKFNLSQKSNDLLFLPRAIGDGRTQYVSVQWEIAEENESMDGLLEKKAKGSMPTTGSATAWLVEFLSGQLACRASKKDIVEAGKKAGHTKNTLERAKERSDTILSVRNGDYHNPYWVLALPAELAAKEGLA